MQFIIYTGVYKVSSFLLLLCKIVPQLYERLIVSDLPIFVFLGIVQLTHNVAITGTATQSSTHVDRGWAASPFVASHANDGNLGSAITSSSGACAMTSSTVPIWWQVDLKKIYEIRKVAITEWKNIRESEYLSILPVKFFYVYFVFFRFTDLNFPFLVNRFEELLY